MTLFKPTLKVNQLIAFQGGHTAFDCTFHSGVNVIRGRNSSGKTTAVDLLAFSLGAENIRWKPEALQCSQVIVEVELNGSPACFRREIDPAAQRPMSIFWGPLAEALGAGPQRWDLYPFKRTTHRVSFSQAIFAALEIPQAQGDGASNLTMHQLLRVLYADQPSVHSPIFRIDSFDSPLTREMVGGYLCGVYDDDLYSAQLRIREIDAVLTRHEAELRSIFNVLGRSGQTSDFEFLSQQAKDLEAKRAHLAFSLVKLKETRELTGEEKQQAQHIATNLRHQLNAARRSESEAKDRFEALQLEIRDSALFVQELESRLQNLEESRQTRSYFGNMQFQFCPSCLSELAVAQPNEGHCHLCKTQLPDGPGDTQLLRMRNEINIQIKESKSLMTSRDIEAAKLGREIPLISQECRRLEQEYSSVSKSWSSEVEVMVEETARKLGVLDEEIRQSYERQKLASVIADLQGRRDELIAEHSRLEDLITNLEKKQEARKREVAVTVGSAMTRLLKLDLPLQKEFVEAKEANFDFVENAVYVNGARNFSESSAVFLRHIFHLSLLTASMEKTYMRVPRFLLLDGIDDGGMEKERSHRLQEIIIGECESFGADYQVIFATSEILPALEGTGYVVGRYYSPEARSIDIR